MNLIINCGIPIPLNFVTCIASSCHVMHASSLSAHCTYLMHAPLFVCIWLLSLKTTVPTRVTSTTTTSTSDSASKRGLQASISTCLLVMSSTFLCTPMFYACLGYVLVCDTYLIYTCLLLVAQLPYTAIPAATAIMIVV